MNPAPPVTRTVLGSDIEKSQSPPQESSGYDKPVDSFAQWCIALGYTSLESGSTGDSYLHQSQTFSGVQPTDRWALKYFGPEQARVKISKDWRQTQSQPPSTEGR